MPKANFCRGRRPLLPQVLVKLGNQPLTTLCQIIFIKIVSLT